MSTGKDYDYEAFACQEPDGEEPDYEEYDYEDALYDDYERGEAVYVESDMEMEPDMEDWGDSLDDRGPGYWEDHLGGPDDGVIERRQEEDLAGLDDDMYL